MIKRDPKEAKKIKNTPEKDFTESFPVPLIIFDLDLSIISLNSRAQKLLKFKEFELRNQKLSFLFKNNCYPIIFKHFIQCNNKDKSPKYTTKILDKFGKEIQVNITFFPFDAEKIQKVGALIFPLDSREEDSSNHCQLSNPQDSIQYEDLEEWYENALDMNLSIDPASGKITKCNMTLSKKLGISKQEILGQLFRDLCPDDQKDIADDYFNKFRHTGLISKVKLSLLKKSRGIIQGEVFARAKRDRYEKILECLVIIRDVTELQEVKSKLLKTNLSLKQQITQSHLMTQKLQAVLESVVDGIITIDPFGHIKSVNPAVEILFGYSKRELMGENISKILTPSHKEIIKENLRATPYPNIENNKIIEGRRKDGSKFPLDIAFSRLKSPGNVMFTAVMRDITDIKNFQDKLEKSNEDLETFNYFASHDLKEPLRAIYNLSLFLLQDYQDKIDDAGKEMLMSLKKQSTRLNILVETLLRLSHIGYTQFDRQYEDMNAIIEEALKSLELTIKEKKAHITVMPDFPALSCNKILMMEVYLNLISNALKYTDKKEIHIEIGYEKQADVPEKSILYVKDNGMGIEKKNLDLIFNIFTRLHQSSQAPIEGAGAGLTIVKKIIESHGGKIWVESAPHEGTTFYFNLSNT